MTLYLPAGLPAIAALHAEGAGRVACIDSAGPGSHRPRIALVNLMPDKPATELQFARQLSRWQGDAELVLARPATHSSTHADPGHLNRFYRPIPQMCSRGIDGLIVTGAPVEHLPFENVHYWRELTAMIDWAAAAGRPSLYVCWSGQAALYHRHGVAKHALDRKAFGVFPQTVERPDSQVLRGMGPNYPCPVSRHTTVLREELPQSAGLAVLADSPVSGLCLVEDRPARALMMFNHLEYSTETLLREYRRDCAAGCDIAPPVGIDSSGHEAARESWRPAAARFFANWLEHVAAARRGGMRAMAGDAVGRSGSGPGSRHVS